jgi:hypothetical protein
VEIHPPGKTFPPNGNPVFHLYNENDDGGMRHHGKDSCLTFDPPADGDYLVKIRSATNDSNRHNSYRLTIRPPKPDFSFSVGPGDLNIPEGSNVVLNCSVLRIDDFNGPVHVRFDSLPAGCTASETDVLPDQENAAVIIHADPGAASTQPDWTIHATATAQINNATVTREARARTITIAHIKPDVELRIDPPVINLEPGGTAPLTVHVQRNNGFAGRVQIDMLNLPFGVEVANNGLNGILVTENETSRTMQLVAQPWLHAMERRISLTGQPATTIQLVYANAAPTALLRIGPNPEKNPRLVQNVAQP